MPVNFKAYSKEYTCVLSSKTDCRLEAFFPPQFSRMRRGDLQAAYSTVFSKRLMVSRAALEGSESGKLDVSDFRLRKVHQNAPLNCEVGAAKSGKQDPEFTD